MTEEQFWNSPLDEEEQWYEDHFDEFVPAPAWVGKSLRKAAKNTMKELNKKKTVTINLDNSVLSYFKQLAVETGIAYQNLINLYLVQCAKEQKRPEFV